MLSPTTAQELQDSARRFQTADDALRAASTVTIVDDATEYLDARLAHQSMINTAEGETRS